MKRGDLVCNKSKRYFVIVEVEPNRIYPEKDRVKAICPGTTKKYCFLKSELEIINGND